MIIFKKARDISQFLSRKSIKTGFVPTMGALHQGHISLINNCQKENDRSVCSIFINPVQFNDPADYEKYPVTIEKDILQLEQAGCDILFLPPVSEIYPHGTTATRHYELGFLETVLEGEFRPGHFQGVCRVMDRLLDIVSCQNLYIGQKDYQQCMVIRKLVHLKKMTDSLAVNICPTLREADGLAMSSRNMRLDDNDRSKAGAIYKALRLLRDQCRPGSLGNLKAKATNLLIENGFKPDYVEIADADTLEIIAEWDGKMKLVGLIAAFLQDVRLIDNMILTQGPGH